MARIFNRLDSVVSKKKYMLNRSANTLLENVMLSSGVCKYGEFSDYIEFSVSEAETIHHFLTR